MASRSAADRWAVVAALLYLVAALNGLGAADIVGDDEAREAGIVQDVLAGHWLWPRFNGELLPDKPTLYHWMAALPCAVAGFSETAVRLPSALAGAALVGWTARFGTTLLDARAGAAAALLLATMPALFTRVRVARPDVLLVLLLALALGAAFRWWRGGARRDAAAALAWLGAATLAKGPVGPALFGLTLVTFLAWQRDLRRLPGLVTVPGVLAFVALGLGWYALAIAGWGDLFVREHLVGRYVRNLAGGLPAGEAYSPQPLRYHLLFYVKHLPLVALPWTPLAALTLWHAWRGGGLRDPRLRFLCCWAAAPVVLFTPAEWKLRYYLLPALPPFALLAAPAALALWRARPRPAALPTTFAAAVAGAAVIGLAGWLASGGTLPLSRSDRATIDALVAAVPGGTAGLAALAGAAGGFVLVAASTRAWGALLAAAGAVVVAWMGLGTPAFERELSRRDSLRSFAEALAARVPAGVPVVFFPETIRAIVVYANRQMPPVHRRRELPRDALVIARADAYGRLVAGGHAGPPLLVGRGRVGNVDNTGVVLFAVGDGRAPPALHAAYRGPGTSRKALRGVRVVGDRPGDATR